MMTPTTDLEQVRQAAEIAQLSDEPCYRVMSGYILRTIPADASQPITAEWLREVWNATGYSGEWQIQGFTGSFYFDQEDDLTPVLSWRHVMNETAVIRNRHQFLALATALGIEPKKGEVCQQ